MRLYVSLAARRGIVGGVVAGCATAALFAAAGCGSDGGGDTGGLPNAKATLAQVIRGRQIVIQSDCAGCHGGRDPSAANWLVGYKAGGGAGQSFQIGPFTTYTANLTPDATTGLGRFSDRQVFNALRFGLDPENSPDVTITGMNPGTGNFPSDPHYLAPPMPWHSTRTMSDEDLWAVVAYLKHGVQPVTNAVPDNPDPGDHWASTATAAAAGPYPIPSYPTTSEVFNP